jgi:hypothetical protein
LAFPGQQHFSDPAMSYTPPSSPARIPAKVFISPVRTRESAASKMDTIMRSPALSVALPPRSLPKPEGFVRERSRSMDHAVDHADPHDFFNNANKEEPATPTFPADTRRAVALPEHDPNNENKTALQVNRQLYRAHRSMRTSVLEASKRFEEQQARHAHDILLTKEAEEGPNKVQAGLVMRRVNNKTDTTEAVKKILEENKKETQSLMEVANKRGGRGRRTRKKTISDMSGMMGSLSQDDLSKILVQAARPAVPVDSPQIVGEGEALSVPMVIETVPESDDLIIRSATVPGEFRKVRDPFGVLGKYGNL